MLLFSDIGIIFWRTLFLTVGILVAVFGMRLVFPLLIVGVTADMGMIEVAKLALNDPAAYSAKLMAHHAEIAAFGGAFLLLVFLNFLFDDEKDTHWFHWLENKLTDLASIPAMSVFLTLIAILVMASAVPDQSRLVVVIAGIWGIVVYVGVQVIGHLLEGKDEEEEESESTSSNTKGNIVKAGIGGFLYLEVLDASFSFDGVIGAFAITSDVVIIMLGLAIGAMFVRSMTIYLVEKGTLEAYIYLEHGAHYAIGALALIMLASGTGLHVPELVTGFIGIVFIVWAVMSSIAYSKRNAEIGSDK